MISAEIAPSFLSCTGHAGKFLNASTVKRQDRARVLSMICVFLLGTLTAGCFLFVEKDINKRAGKVQIQSDESANDGVQVVLQKGHSDMIHAVVVSPDGRMVLTGSEDETARLWDVSSGQMIRSFEI